MARIQSLPRGAVNHLVEAGGIARCGVRSDRWRAARWGFPACLQCQRKTTGVKQ